MQPARPSTAKRLTSIAVSVVLLAVAAWVLFNRQFLQDQLTLLNYQAPAEVAALAENASLSPLGTDLFYVNYPELHDKGSFSQVCSGVGDEKSNVLGCFNGSRIYIFNVTDPELAGVREVTAAHEMLHAAYMRLSSPERKRVNNLLEKQLRIKVAPHITELITIYKRLEPGELLNEMHSILATEQHSLIPELEDYFSQYFKDRSKVVGLSDAYRAVFDTLRTQQQALAVELDTLAEQINSGTAALNARIAAYNTRVEQFNQRATSGTMTQAEFTNERGSLQAERGQIEVDTRANDVLRQTYEQKRQEFESLAVEFTRLQNTINSRPAETEKVE